MTSRVVSLKGRPIKRLLPDEVYVGTKCYRGGWSPPASKWANPYVAGQHGTLAEVIARYERVWLLASPAERLAIIATTRPRITRVWPKLYTGIDRPLIADIAELRGWDLACWCHPAPCHGDVLLRLAVAPRQIPVCALFEFVG